MSHISLYKCYNGDCATCVLHEQKRLNLISCVRYERKIIEYPGRPMTALKSERPLRLGTVLR